MRRLANLLLCFSVIFLHSISVCADPPPRDEKDPPDDFASEASATQTKLDISVTELKKDVPGVSDEEGRSAVPHVASEGERRVAPHITEVESATATTDEGPVDEIGQNYTLVMEPKKQFIKVGQKAVFTVSKQPNFFRRALGVRQHGLGTKEFIGTKPGTFSIDANFDGKTAKAIVIVEDEKKSKDEDAFAEEGTDWDNAQVLEEAFEEAYNPDDFMDDTEEWDNWVMEGCQPGEMYGNRPGLTHEDQPGVKHDEDQPDKYETVLPGQEQTIKPAIASAEPMGHPSRWGKYEYIEDRYPTRRDKEREALQQAQLLMGIMGAVSQINAMQNRPAPSPSRPFPSRPSSSPQCRPAGQTSTATCDAIRQNR